MNYTKNTGKQRLLQKWKGKLAVWLGVLILTVNLSVLLICFGFQYGKVKNMLLKKDETDNIERLIQAEYNIGLFCQQVEIVSRTLSMDLNLKKLSNSRNMFDSDLFYHAREVLSQFETMQFYYPYIHSICYYGRDGLILKTINDRKQGNCLIKDEEKTDWYYSSEICQAVSKSRQKLKWFGGYKETDFGFEGGENDGIYYMSAARNIISGTGTLVINIEMDYFLNTFCTNSTLFSGNIYIVNENNRIVAARERESIGKERIFAEGKLIYDRTVTSLEEGENGKFQVITYFLPDLGWRFASETSIAEAAKESIYLRNILLCSCLVSVVVSFALSVWWVSEILKPLNELTVVMQKVGNGQLGCVYESPPKNELGIVAEQFNQMSVDLKEIFEQKERVEEEKRKIEMQTLRSQINPHLIYNTLNTIKWMAIINEERNIAESITLLADFLKPVFRNQELLCSVKEELEYVEKYIAIMNLRGTEGYQLEIAVPEKYYEYRIIRFLLQPVVENAILHGLAEREFGKISISIKIDKDMVIQVKDDGKGIEEKKLKELQKRLKDISTSGGKEIGIENVNRRIKVQYGDEYGLELQSEQGRGTVVTLKIKPEIQKK